MNADQIGNELSTIDEKLVSATEAMEEKKRIVDVLKAEREELRAQALAWMVENDTKSTSGNNWRITRKKSADKVVLDVMPEDLPEELVVTKPTANKKLIKKALQEHIEEVMKYAHLDRGEHVVVSSLEKRK